MSKKKRDRRKTIYIGLEGYREVFLVKYIKSLFFCDENKSKTTIESDNLDGGTPLSMLKRVLEESGRRHEVYLIIDNDTTIDTKANKNDLKDVIARLKKCWCISDNIPQNITLKELASYNTNRRKPIIIVSQPINMDGVIIKIFGQTLPPLSIIGNSDQDKQRLKTKCDNILKIKKNANKEEKEIQTLSFYKANLSKEMLEKKSQELPCLNEIIQIFL